MIRPVYNYTISSPFGIRWGMPHYAVDYAVPVGTPVYAPDDAEIYKFDHSKCGYGLILTHDDGIYKTGYCHLSQRFFNTGDKVKKGEIIALTGGKVGAPGSGNSQGAHLHYTLRKNGSLIDPEGITYEERIQNIQFATVENIIYISLGILAGLIIINEYTKEK
jgi:murein DD-endopeptidase MepM/ murein hydrolase activator NlpD